MFNTRLIRLMVIQGLLLAVLCSVTPHAMAGKKSVDYVNVTKATGDVKHVAAKVVINAPPQFVWQTITGYSQLQRFVPGYKKCRVISNQGAVKTLDVDMSVSRFMPSYKYQVRVQENRRDLKLNLKRISGDFKRFDGTYKLHAANNGAKTVLIYDLNIDSGVKVPGSSAVLKTSVEKTLAAVRTQAERRHQKSLIGKK